MPRISKYPDPQVGQQFGRWTITSDKFIKNGHSYVRCVCICGRKADVCYINLVRDKTHSCGCLNDKMGTFIHGESHTRLHNIWNSMRSRCSNPKVKLYKYYGARGISVCSEWRKHYISFRDWSLQNGYAEHLVLDRIDTHGNYGPNNCRWTTQKQNMRNARSNHMITAFGETKCIGEWLEDPRCQVSKYNTLWRRVSVSNWTPEQAITIPIKINKD